MKALSTWHFHLSKRLTGFYFSKITVHGERSMRPTLYIASHRNGATDGQVYTWAIGDTPSLVSIQILRKWYLALIFDGIPVVRPQDSERYGIAKDAVRSPIEEAVQQLAAGGSLSILAEGTSEWDYQPIEYKNGMAKIVAQLKAHNIDFAVQAVGVFYTKPDGFRSRVSVILGKPFVPLAQDEAGIFQEMSMQLDAVSVNCHSVTQFNQIENQAWNQAKQHQQDYGQAFLALQQQTQSETSNILNAERTLTVGWHRYLGYFFQLLFLIGLIPTVVLALLAQKGADGRNNVTFFRILGGVYGSVLTLLYWLMVLIFSPMVGVGIIFAGWVGWYFYPEPSPIELQEKQ